MSASFIWQLTFMVPIFKLPLFLYRVGLGWLMGKRFMLLTHIGRRSGNTRKTVLAVLRFDDKTNEIMAISAWSSSDWYKNIQVSPAVQVETGFVRYAPVQHAFKEILSEKEYLAESSRPH